MDMDNDDEVELNRETAMRLWNVSFGNETRVMDFAGRTMAKGAYNDRNSEFGWNLDHILPQSKGGKTADYNLVCCHIRTNDEKADRFPTFRANDQSFQVVKVENHYEIRSLESFISGCEAEGGIEVNFMDSASGLREFKRLVGKQNRKRLVGNVLVRLRKVQNTALVEFVEKLFADENVTISSAGPAETILYSSIVMPDITESVVLQDTGEVRMLICDYQMTDSDGVVGLLDKCILLNTYLGSYFVPRRFIEEYDIYYRVMEYDNSRDMVSDVRPWNIENVYDKLNKSLFINKVVYEYSETNGKKPNITFSSNDQLMEYNYTFGKLEKNLRKEADGE